MLNISIKVKKYFLGGVILILAALMVFSVVSCNQDTLVQTVLGEPADEQTIAEEPAAEEPPVEEEEIDDTIDFVGSASVDPISAPIGSDIIVSGTGMPADQVLDLVWNTFEGLFDIQGDFLEEYHGRIFKDVKYTITTVQTDADGNFQGSITVPEDFGFNHNITIEVDGKVLNRTGFSIEPTASLEQESGPLGSPITIIMTGIGPNSMENSWTVMYDNKYTGFLSAVTTGGTATAVIPATGGLGKHSIRIIHGGFQYPYLNSQQNPRPDQPIISLEFTITEGEPVLPSSVEDQRFATKSGSAPTDETSEPVLWVDPMEGPNGIEATLYGSGFSSGKDVMFNWVSVSGNRVSGLGWEEIFAELGTATVDEDGNLSHDFAVPEDLGGNHRINAIIDGNVIASTGLTLKPSALPLEVSSGPVGTEIKINLKGVGWTETANIYTLVYDNAYLGYACGFNSQGDITIFLPLAGDPGWHFIDLYPAIYKGKEIKGTQNFRIPQLTYQEDHPGEDLPAFHFAVEVTE